MADTAVPHFFDEFPMQRVVDASLDEVLATAPEPIVVLFLWGRDCVNCDLAKRDMLRDPQRFAWPEVRWLHDNVYEDPSMGTRFGLHGIPTFIVFRGGRKIGKISPYPGRDAFCAAIAQQIEKGRASDARDGKGTA